MPDDQHGWIKLHRKVMESRVWKNHELFHVWAWCLLRANHKDQWVTIATGRGTTSVHVKPGQFVFGRLKAAKALGMKPSSVRNRMEKLRNMRNLDIQPDSHCSIVTICNWEEYQKSDESSGQPEGQAKDKHRTGIGQAKDTDKKEENGNNGKKEPPKSPLAIPESLSEAWPAWEKYRKERRSALTPSTREKQIKKLSKHDTETAIAMIEQSITNGWIGLFDLKGNSNDNPHTTRKGIGPSAQPGQQFDEPALLVSPADPTKPGHTTSLP